MCKKAKINMTESGRVLIAPKDMTVSMLILEWLADNKRSSFKISVIEDLFYIHLPNSLRGNYIALRDYINLNT